MNMTSRALLAVLIAVVVVIVVAVGAWAVISAAPPTTPTPSPSPTRSPSPTAPVTAAKKEYLIGLPIAVSGGYAEDGPRRLHAAQLAIDDMNSKLAASGSNIGFKWIHEDTKSTAEGAISAVPRLASAGAQIFVGPLATSECKAILDFLSTKKIVAISPSSTGTAARVKNDFCFRMPPPDVYQAPAIARIAWQVGIRKFVILARNDDYGKGLADGVKKTFEGLGGQTKEILYDYTQPDLSPYVERTSAAVSSFGAGPNTGVLMIGFDETLKIYDKARLDKTLSSVRWFGNDAVKRPTFLPPKSSKEIAEFQKNVRILGTAPAVGPKENPLVASFVSRYTKRFGEPPSVYSYYAYDAAMVAMLTVMHAGKYDGAVFQKLVPWVSMHYYGVTGWKLLDEYGDSAAPLYDIWTVAQKPDGTWYFKTLGFYDGATQTAKFYEKP